MQPKENEQRVKGDWLISVNKEMIRTQRHCVRCRQMNDGAHLAIVVPLPRPYYGRFQQTVVADATGSAKSPYLHLVQNDNILYRQPTRLNNFANQQTWPETVQVQPELALERVRSST